VAKDREREFRLRPRKPSVANARSESTAWSLAFKAVIHHSRMSRKQGSSAGSSQSPLRKSFHQRCAVRVTYSPNTIKGQWRAHGRYVARDSATREGQADAAEFNANADAVDMARSLDAWQQAGDERMWKFIISPEFGERADLRKLTRDLMAQIAHDLGTDLEWAAAVHHNTEHPHVHIALRGVDSNGQALRLDRDYVKHGIRAAAENLCTRQLGYRTERDAEVAASREVHEARYTSLDRDIARLKDEGDHGGSAFHFKIVAGASGSTTVRQQQISERLTVLQTMGLASAAGPNSRQVRSDFESILRAMQRTSDRQKMLHAHGVLLSDERLPLVVTDHRKLNSLEGRVLVHGEEENGRDAGRSYLLLEGTDARVHYILYTPEIEETRSSGRLRANSFLRLRKLFVDGKPLLEVQDLGPAEAMLNNEKHLTEAARVFLKRGILPSEDGWGGWLGRYQAALRSAAMEIADPSDLDRTRQKRRGVER